MTARKRAAKKAPVKRSNSQISAAQKAASDARKARVAAAQAKADRGGAPIKGALPPDKNNSTLSAGNPPLTDPKVQAAQDSVNNRNSDTLTKSTLQQNVRPTAKAASQPSTAGDQIAGLALQFRPAAVQAQAQKSKLADPSLYGKSDAQRAQNITERSAAYAEAQRQRILQQKGSAVWMGSTKKQVQIRAQGPQRQDENGSSTSTQTISLEDVKTKDELMSWLADEKTFNQIKKRMTDAGIQVQSYDDVAKLWQSVVDQAAASYTTLGKKVTPWALISLRGKSMVNGRPAPKTTTSTSVEEMDPAQAKVMIKNSLSQLLGRDPQKNEIEDFIAKAQTIARQNPNITKTTTQYDIAGNPISQSSVSSGGSDVVTAKAQLAAEEQAKQSEDYAAYQGAGVYMPWLMDALAAPV